MTNGKQALATDLALPWRQRRSRRSRRSVSHVGGRRFGRLSPQSSAVGRRPMVLTRRRHRGLSSAAASLAVSDIINRLRVRLAGGSGCAIHFYHTALALAEGPRSVPGSLMAPCPVCGAGRENRSEARSCDPLWDKNRLATGAVSRFRLATVVYPKHPLSAGSHVAGGTGGERKQSPPLSPILKGSI